MSDLHLTVTGDGPGIVCTHGFADDSATFAELVPHLATRHRVVGWDLPGHGRSPVGMEPASRATALGGLREAIAAAGPTPVGLVGHSLGGYLSMCHAIGQPVDVAALVLLSTGPGFRNAERRTAWNAGIADLAVARGVSPLAAPIGEQPDSFVLDNLDRLTMPVLLIVGERDRTYHRGNELLERSLGDATLLVVPGAGHFPHRTNATEVNAAIDQFLGRVLTA